MRPLRVAAVSVDNKPGQTSDNLAKIDSWAKRAADSGAHLVLFPELSLTGFLPNHPPADRENWLRAALAEVLQMAERIPGPAVADLTRIAARYRLMICAGMLEAAEPLPYNTQVLVGPEGVIGRWRKMHIPKFEIPFTAGGDVPEVAETPLARVGVNICFDTHLPESTRLLALGGAELVLMPFAADPPPRTPQAWAAWAGPAIRARCRENAVFALACNYVGRVTAAGIEQEFPGGAMIVDPFGELLAEWPADLSGPEMILADLDPDRLRAAREHDEFSLPFRRPELYGRLARD